MIDSEQNATEHNDPISVDELIRRWRQRRREILDTLPPELLKEYRRLGASIKSATDASGTSADARLARISDILAPILNKVANPPEVPAITLNVMSRVPTSLTWVGLEPAWQAMRLAWCQANGIQCFSLSETQLAEDTWLNFADHVKLAGGTPCFILQNKENYIVAQGKPRSYDEFLELMKPLLRPITKLVTINARVPMSEHKKNLIDFLQMMGTATRAEILQHTGIPEGSLSQLLREDGFEQVERGRWKLKKEPNEAMP